MGQSFKNEKIIQVIDAHRSGPTYSIVPAHAKVIGVFKDMMETVGDQEKMEPVKRFQI